MKKIARRISRGIGWTVQGLALVIMSYVAAGLIGGSIPANPRWVPPTTGGVHIFVEDNGVHTGLILPVSAAGVDWGPSFPASDIADPRYARLGWRAFGWGDRAFYVETPTWADVKVSTIARAAVGSTRTVLHVEHRPQPHVDKYTREIVITEDQYRRLADHIRATIGPGGKIAKGYGVNDVFYDGQGTYSMFHTCNAWTGRGLASAGVRVGVWTPFPIDVTTWF